MKILIGAIGIMLLSLTQISNAQSCSDYPGGVLDGFAGTVAPAELKINQDCTIRNYPNLSTNFSFFTQPGQNDQRYLVVFDNVMHGGQMACSNVAQHIIWFANSFSLAIQQGCQNLLIPIEKVDKESLTQLGAKIGEPFVYKLIIPVLYDPATGSVINNLSGSADLSNLTITDDLNATGLDLSYVSHTAYKLGSGDPVTPTFSNIGNVLTFTNFPVIPVGEQIVIEITVVLEDTANNKAHEGTQFDNTAKAEFTREIDGVLYDLLPAQSGISTVALIGEKCFGDSESAWVAGDLYEGFVRNWATYVTYPTVNPVDIYAGRNMLAGTAIFEDSLSDPTKVTVTISLDGWAFVGDKENLKIQNYETVPTWGDPKLGRFAIKEDVLEGTIDYTIDVPKDNYYGIHLEVAPIVPCPIPPEA